VGRDRGFTGWGPTWSRSCIGSRALVIGPQTVSQSLVFGIGAMSGIGVSKGGQFYYSTSPRVTPERNDGLTIHMS